MSAESGSDDRTLDERAFIDCEQVDGLIGAAGVDGAKEILAAFWRCTDRLLAVLQDQIARGDLPEAAKTAHSLKGSAMNVGAHRLSVAARSIEEACKALDGVSAQERLPAASDHYSQSIGAFEAVFKARRQA
ncbi:MAG: Hpt domain-containing protein [Parvularculaceae bacterium]